MATTVAPTTAPAPTALTTHDINTFYRVVFITGLDTKGQPTQGLKIVNDKTGQEIKASAKNPGDKMTFDGKEVVLLEAQSFIQPTAKTDAGWQELIPLESERAAMTARGASTKLDNKARSWLSAVDDEDKFVNAVTEFPYDQTEDLKAESNRRLSPLEKLSNDIDNLAATPAALEALQAKLDARRLAMQGQNAPLPSPSA